MKPAYRNACIAIAVILIAGLVAARLYLNTWLLDYVNRVLANLPGYSGSAQSLDIDLYRGAYRIHQLKIDKKEGNIPVPFVAIETVDLSIQWSALFNGRIVSNADLDKPVLNFAVGKSGNEQTGTEVDWNKPIRDLMPIDINLVTFKDGQVTYRDFSTTPQVNIYIHHMQGEVKNLRNVVDRSEKLPSTLSLKGDSIGGGRLKMDGRLNILKPVPDMDIKTQLTGVDLTALNDYSNAYAFLDIRSGKLDFYSELNVENNRVSGYAKPLATGVELIDLKKSANPIKLAWEAVVAVVVEIFTNHPRDQFATKIPLEGTLDDVNTPTLPAIAGIIRNAFFKAFAHGFDASKEMR